MVPLLRERGWVVNRKRVQRLRQRWGLAGRVPGPHPRRPHPEPRVYPYLLRGVAITQPNQAWSTDITYLRLARGWGYLVAIIDWYSRKVLTWRLSNTLEVGFCIESLQEALRRFGVPEIFNTDQPKKGSCLLPYLRQDNEIMAKGGAYEPADLSPYG